MMFTDEELRAIQKKLSKRLILGLFVYNRLTVLELSDLDMFYMPKYVKRLFNPSTVGETPEEQSAWQSIICKLKGRGGLYQFLNSKADDARKLWDFMAQRHFAPVSNDELKLAYWSLADLRLVDFISLRKSDLYQKVPADQCYLRLTRMDLVKQYMAYRVKNPTHYFEFSVPVSASDAIKAERINANKKIEENERRLTVYFSLSLEEKFNQIDTYWNEFRDWIQSLIDNKFVAKYPLLSNAITHDIDIANLLLIAGADVNSCKTEIAGTPLANAASMKEAVQAIELLLANGADVNKPHPMTGETPLILAIKSGNTDNVRCLLAHGANVNQGDRHGTTPLIYATEYKNIMIVALLLAYKADVNPRVSGKTALDKAKYSGQRQIIKLLQDAAEQQAIEAAAQAIAAKERAAAANAQAMTALPFTASWDMMYAPVETVDNNTRVQVNKNNNNMN